MTESAAKVDGQADGDTSKKDRIVKIIGSMINKVSEADNQMREVFFQELSDLKKVIDESRAEIGMARPGDIQNKDIPTAADELDAVIASTEEATGTIMDACEEIQNQADKIEGEHADAINNEVMKIYEACSFQDITGQRINKVMTTLQSIDERVGHLISVLGDKLTQTGEAVDERVGDERLLNGPQLPDQGVSQDEIDKLLAEFDSQ